MSTFFKIISLNISTLSYEHSIEKILNHAQDYKPSYVCFSNVHMVIEAYHDKNFADQVNRATLVLPDGMPLVKTLKLFYHVKQDRIAGMDVMPDLIRLAGPNKVKVFFFGTTSELLKRIQMRMERDFPGTEIAGLYSPPFDKSLDEELYIDMINCSGAGLVFVALGCPKQEKWMATHSSKIKAVLLGVGGAFPVFAGITKRAPLFMQNIGMEWIYRLFQEPNRLFKRYLTTNSLFIYLVLKSKIKNIFR